MVVAMYGTLVKLIEDTDDIVLSVYGSGKAIFSEFAPKGVKTPYLVITVTEDESIDSPEITGCIIMVDYYDANTSRVMARKTILALKHLFKLCQFSTDEYDTVRMSYFSGGVVPEGDDSFYHHNLQFQARAGNKAWCEQLKEA